MAFQGTHNVSVLVQIYMRKGKAGEQSVKKLTAFGGIRTHDTDCVLGSQLSYQGSSLAESNPGIQSKAQLGELKLSVHLESHSMQPYN